MNISIIIVNYNVKEFIIPCIKSIYKHSKSDLKFEVIVVDNNSKDNSVKELKKAFLDIQLIANKTNVGFSKAVNQGVKVSKGQFIFILNPDTLIQNDCIKIMHSEALKLERMGVCAPKIFNNKGILERSFWKFPSLINTVFSIFHLDFLNYYKNYSNKKFNNKTSVESVSGCAIFMKKRVFNELNGFNEKLFWMEDIDLCKRLIIKGYEIFYLPNAEIIHFKGRSAKKNYKISISNQLLSKIKYFNIHHTKFSYIVITLTIAFSSMIKLLIFYFLSLFSLKYRKKSRAYLHTVNMIIKNQML